jgi:predicted NBD/HSP70 family sugar kinase
MRPSVNAMRAGRQNRVVVLETVQHAGAISRTGLVAATGLTPPTITNAVRELIERRLLVPTGERAPRAAGGAGAPSPLLALDGTWHRVLTIHQGVSQLRVGLHDLAGRLLARRDLGARHGERPEAAVTRIARGLRRLCQEEGVDGERIRGVGMGAVGLIDPDGVVRAAPNLGWDEVPLRTLLEEEIQLPLVVRNNTQAMAAGELRFGSVPDQDAVYVYIGTGIGAALIGPEGVREGSHGAAGEIGHLIVPGGTACTCGKVGCLETVAAEPAVARSAGMAPPGQGDYKREVQRLVEEAKRGGAEARAVLARVGDDIGHALAQVVEIVDPGAVIIGGAVAQAGELFLEPLGQAMHANAFAVRGRRVPVRQASFGRDAGLIGAAAVALERFVYHPGAEVLAEPSAGLVR